MNNNEETDFVEDFLAGDTETLKDIYRRYFPVVQKFVLKNSGTETDAKDVFQDALVFTFQKLKSDSLSLNCSLTTYIFAVCRNMWMNTLRRRKKTILWDELPNSSDDVNQDILDQMQEQSKLMLYHKSFLQLGDVCQELLRNFFLGKTMQEISSLLNFSVGYTRKKKFECKKRLLELVEGNPLYRELVEK